MPVTIRQLFRESGLDFLKVKGPLKWGQRLQSNNSGVYIISSSEDISTNSRKINGFKASELRFDEWEANAPDFEVNGKKPNVKELTAYLESLYDPEENILYIGQTSSTKRNLGVRVNEFYKHKVGMNCV